MTHQQFNMVTTCESSKIGLTSEYLKKNSIIESYFTNPLHVDLFEYLHQKRFF